MKINVKKKLFAGLSTVFVLLVVIVGVAYVEIMDMDKSYENLINGKMKKMIEIKQLEVMIQNEKGSMGSYLIIGDPTSLTNFNKAHDEYKRLSEELAKELTKEKARELLAKLNELEQQFYQLGQKAFQLKRENDVEAYTKLISTAGREITSRFDKTSQQLAAVQQVDLDTEQADVSSQAEFTKTLLIAVGGIAIVLGFVVALYISFIISKPVIALSEIAKRVASGDLTRNEIVIKNRDEIGELATAFNQMMEYLRTIIQQVSANAEQVAASSEQLTASAEQTSKATEQIAATMQNMSLGMDKQVQSVEEQGKTVHEMSNDVQRVTERTQNVAAIADSTLQKAVEGSEIVQTAVIQMNSINDTITNLSNVVQTLGERSEQIGNIIEIITGIAEQTNLLSLNAAIEAARAGEHGRGFAVVADEVRKLAEQSAQSAQQVSALIASIQQETKEAVQSMEMATKEVTDGIVVIHTAGQSFTQIKDAIHEVVAQVQEVSSAVQKMSSGTKQIVQSMQLIHEIAKSAAAGTQEVSVTTEEQLASMQEIAASAMALSSMAESLQQLIQKFKIS
ncbi:methyl-accepting chemotaxis protein [Anoxybacillus tepidamans]|uniref:Methyl-accepting chemotaxis protein n=1 Tax=Anoxybacteroides tepidamans TaxID=265948 RepID=A0A7W8IT06_9BACL|nr:methyl-accepting chemotaxis protein [Anoxybacillus tepidamans]MBB5325411.1 methyl-accepting chemotaxis protein [Anoxybacillus tepidamans]